MAIVVEKSVAGVVELTTSVLFGELDEEEENITETRESRRTYKNKLRMPTEDIV